MYIITKDTINDLDYGWIVLLSKNCISINTPLSQDNFFLLTMENLDFKQQLIYAMASESLFRKEVTLL